MKMKFKVWHSVEKQMYTSEDKTYCITLDGKVVSVYDDQRWDDSEQEILIPIQSTGLQDKNGLDIYEGDLLQSFGGNAIIIKVKWGDISQDGSVIGYNISESFSYCEIIGNIYQNPDLAKIAY